MDSLPKPSRPDAAGRLPEAVHSATSAALEALAPRQAGSLPGATADFLRSGERLVETVHLASSVDAGALRKQGMILSALTFRARELAARWKLFDACVADLLTRWSPVDDLLTRSGPPASSPASPGFVAPDWPAVRDTPLPERLREYLEGWACTEKLAREIASAPRAATRLVTLVRLRDDFSTGAWAALEGSAGLLKLFPQIHGLVSTRLFHQDGLRG